jgi:hypothetical protein
LLLDDCPNEHTLQRSVWSSTFFTPCIAKLRVRSRHLLSMLRKLLLRSIVKFSVTTVPHSEQLQLELLGARAWMGKLVALPSVRVLINYESSLICR